MMKNLLHQHNAVDVQDAVDAPCLGFDHVDQPDGPSVLSPNRTPSEYLVELS